MWLTTIGLTWVISPGWKSTCVYRLHDWSSLSWSGFSTHILLLFLSPPRLSVSLRENRRCVCVSVCVCVCECQYEWRQCECIYLSLSLSLSHHRSMVPRISTEVREDIIHLRLFLCLSLSLSRSCVPLCLSNTNTDIHTHTYFLDLCVYEVSIYQSVYLYIYMAFTDLLSIYLQAQMNECVFFGIRNVTHTWRFTLRGSNKH